MNFSIKYAGKKKQTPASGKKSRRHRQISSAGKKGDNKNVVSFNCQGSATSAPRNSAKDNRNINRQVITTAENDSEDSTLSAGKKEDKKIIPNYEVTTVATDDGEDSISDTGKKNYKKIVSDHSRQVSPTIPGPYMVWENEEEPWVPYMDLMGYHPTYFFPTSKSKLEEGSEGLQGNLLSEEDDTQGSKENPGLSKILKPEHSSSRQKSNGFHHLELRENTESRGSTETSADIHPRLNTKSPPSIQPVAGFLASSQFPTFPPLTTYNTGNLAGFAPPGLTLLSPSKDSSSPVAFFESSPAESVEFRTIVSAPLEDPFVSPRLARMMSMGFMDPPEEVSANILPNNEIQKQQHPEDDYSQIPSSPPCRPRPASSPHPTSNPLPTGNPYSPPPPTGVPCSPCRAIAPETGRPYLDYDYSGALNTEYPSSPPVVYTSTNCQAGMDYGMKRPCAEGLGGEVKRRK